MTNFAHQPQPLGRAPKVWENVPPRNRNFTGREQLLAELRASIAGDVTAVVSQPEPHALHGMGGVGKTMLVVEYAWRYRGDYDLVCWIPSDQPVLVRSTLASLAVDLGLPPATATGIEDAARAVLNALRLGEPFRDWLLIFDNADQPEEIKDIIPAGGPGHVLITSRNPRWDAEANAISIDVFTRSESVEFLSKRVPRAINDKQADELAQELGDLPLALEQAGALQAETGMPVEEYLRLLKERTASLLAEGKPTEYPASMTAAWGLSVTNLKRKLPEAEELLRCCAFFGPEAIPRAVFDRGPENIGERLASLLRDPIEFSRAIGELGRFALARVDTANRTIQVHRLIQALVRDDLPEWEKDRFRDDVRRLLAAATPKAPDNTSNWPRYAGLLAHVVSSGVAESRDPQMRSLALDYVRYLYVSGDYRSARLLVENFEKLWETSLGPKSVDVLNARRHRGIIVRELGQYSEAYELNQETLSRMDGVSSTDPGFQESRLLLLNSIGADLRARGRFIDAQEHDERSLHLHTEAYGPDHPRTLLVTNNLALDLGLISKYEEARQSHKLSYLGMRTTSGIGRGDILNSWNGLARAVRLCGEYQAASDAGAEALAFGVEELGADHPLTLRTMKDLAIARRRAGDFEEALELALDCHSRYERLFGLNHPDSLASAMCLANAWRSIGQLDDAYELAVKTLDLYPKMYGPDHPYIHGCAGNLAILLRVRSEVAEARQRNEAALAGLEARLGRDHHFSLTVATNLASDLAALGDLESARRLGAGTRRRLITVLGEMHPMTLACTANLAADMIADGIEDEGTELFNQTIDQYTRTLSLDHPDAIVAYEKRHLDCDFDPAPI
ncbi:FxSxx-COOH system tetratricopeptide repeat protein [Spirillospora sp. NPDC048911]|uniref:FxSxx-COOH system tetratricopeptide repeat protein n=1 Tax=Spirillospora sp. NPDC048911 TaxID=3364527 RepID=UPI0037154FE6